MMMLKQLLGVQKQTTNIGVLIELGRSPLNLSATKFAVKNWERIRIGKGNNLLLGSYKDGELSWDMNIKQILDSNGMQSFYNTEPNTEYPFLLREFSKNLVKISTEQVLKP